MNSDEINKERLAIVGEAKSWIGTPFLHARNVKGAGGDCQSIITNPFGVVFNRVIEVPAYSSQWHLHAGEDGDVRELYIDTLLKNNCIEIRGVDWEVEPYDENLYVDAAVEPGDIVLARMGRTYCHGGIVINWPDIIQAESKVCGRGSVQLANADASWYMSGRPKKFFSWKNWHD